MLKLVDAVLERRRQTASPQKETQGELATVMHLRRVTRGVEVLLGVAAFMTAVLTAYTAYEFVEQATVTRDWLLQMAPLAFLVLLLVGSVMILGLRLVFARFRPEGRLIAPAGVAGYVVVSLSLFAIAWWQDGRFPPQAWPFLAGGIIGLMAFLLFGRKT